LRWPDRDLDDSNQNQIPNVLFGSDSVIRRCRLAALIAVLRALVEAEASQDRGHTADGKRGGYSRPHDIL
jgi:hypothetical protein